jgi:SMC interacting uncharacterized protein involved in chromosome segregation
MERTTWNDERLDERMVAVDHTSERIFAELVGIREDMRSFRLEVKNEIGDLRTEVKSDISDLRTEVKSEIAELRRELKTEIKTEVGDLRSELSIFRDRMLQIGFALLGVTIASIAGILIAAITAGG